MNSGKRYFIGIFALIVSIAAVTLSYAGFTQTLTINGSGTVKATKWDVHFENVTTNRTGTASFTTEPTATGTTISSWYAQLMSPGDTVTISFYVKNAGNFSARFIELTKGSLSCSGPSNYESVCNNLEYKLYKGLTGNNEVTAADQTSLTPLTGSQAYRLVLTFKDEANLNPNVLPSGTDVIVSIPEVTFSYIQDGNAVFSN